MPVIREVIYYARCDGPDCPGEEGESLENWEFSSRKELVKDAKEQGWRVDKDGRIYCPECREE